MKPCCTRFVGLARKRRIPVLVGLAFALMTHGAAFAQHALKPGVTGEPTSEPALKSLSAPQDATRLTPILELQHKTYVTGEPILVRLGFKNLSSEVIEIRSGAPPWSVSTMSVTGPDGRVLPRGLVEIGGDDGSGRVFSIAPGATQFIAWKQQEWYPLDHWSYHLTSPGLYRIVVRALAFGPRTIHVDKEQSATVRLRIDPLSPR